MKENNIPEDNLNSPLSEKGERKEPVPPTVELLPDLNGEAFPSFEEGNEGAQPVLEPKDEKPKRKRPTEKKGVSVPVFVSVVLLCVIATFMATYISLYSSFGEKYRELYTAYSDSSSALSGKLKAIEEELKQNYLYDIDEDELEDSVLKGYLGGIGDKYAEYFNKDEMEQLMADSNAEMQGIGISVVYDAESYAIEVINVFSDSPAGKAGIKSGDLIVYVKEGDDYEAVATLGYTVALKKLQGKAGTVANFAVSREGEDELLEFSIERGYVTEYTVTYSLYEADPKVGIIAISSFDSKTPEQFKSALENLKKQGVEKLVFDVRNNPGGELTSVCTILDMLLPEGPVVRTLDKDGNEETVYTSDKEEVDMPMAVITNGNTASAGELFTAALKDYDKAVIVGEKTYGKGSMQTVRSFNDGTGFKYTYRYYCPPYSDNYDGIGIEPDIKVSLSEAASNKNIYTLTDGEDDQKRAAVDALK